MKMSILMGIAVLALTACVNNNVMTKTRNLDLTCSNGFTIMFTERLQVTNFDSTLTITTAVKSRKMNQEISMKQARAASGVRYVSKDGKYIFWEHQGEFTFGTEDSTYCLCD